MKFTQRGFTLIELLVVIAIIGILASVVLVSFPGATKKANDARVISAIAQARTVMTYINANDGDYGDFDCTHADMVVLCNEVAGNSYNDTALTTQNDGDDEACMYAPLNATDGASWYCADSTGIAGTTVTNPATADCMATSWTCPSDTE